MCDLAFEFSVEKYNRNHDTKGRFASRGATATATRAERAKSTYKPSTAAKQRLADKSEQHLAKELGADRTPDNSPFDLIKGKVGIEVKTLIDNKNDKITMHPESRMRKLRAARQLKVRPHTIVIDQRGPVPAYYFAKGVASFRLRNMQQVSLDQLRSILS